LCRWAAASPSGVGVGVGLPDTGALIGSSRPSFVRFTVVQSSLRMPPVSPEFGFYDQNVQLIPDVPWPR
jgi:hypothetical protein